MSNHVSFRSSKLFTNTIELQSVICHLSDESDICHLSDGSSESDLTDRMTDSSADETDDLNHLISVNIVI